MEILEIQLGLNSFYARLGAGFVGIAAGRSRHTDRADQRSSGLDQSPTNNDDARQVSNSRLHHSGLADGEQIAGAAAKGCRRPRLARGRRGRMWPGIAVTQNDLCYAKAIAGVRDL